jgi:hypothetical protein
MRVFQLAASAALACVGLGISANAQSQVICPTSAIGPASVDTGFYSTDIFSTPAGLKPRPIPYQVGPGFDQKGLCIDSARSITTRHRRRHHVGYPGGDIHLYLADAAYYQIKFTIPGSIGTFDTNDRDGAFKAPGQDLCAPNSVPSPAELDVCLRSMGNGHYYPYYMRYLDLNGVKHKIEPGTHDH